MPETKKKKKTDLKISAELAEEDHLDLTINGKTINCKIYQDGRIKFQYKHPDVKKKMTYEGLVEDDKLWLYPIIGEGVLMTGPVSIK